MKNKYARLLSYLLRNQLPYWYGTFKSQDYEVIKQHIQSHKTKLGNKCLCWAFEDLFNYKFEKHGDINYPELTGPDKWYNDVYWYEYNQLEPRVAHLDAAIEACYGLPMIQLFGHKIYNIVFP